MDRKTVGRLIGLLVITALLVASIVTMYVGLARFEPTWFWSTVAGFVVGLFLVLFIFRIRPEEEDAMLAAMDRAAGASKAGMLAAASLPQAPLAMEKATGMLPTETVVQEKPAGYTFRGYTLVERTVRGKSSREFVKKVPADATPILLPTGFEASWDARKKTPKLVRIIDEAPEVVVERGAGKPCSAWTGPGEVCENVAVTGSAYCKKHANYRGGMSWGDIEARIPRGGEKGRAFRAVTPTMQVITSKPKARPLKLKIPTVDVRIARPTGKPRKPLRFAEPNLEVRIARGKGAKPLRVGAPNVVVRDTKPKAPKPLRVGTPTAEVRQSRPKAGKPLRVAEPRLEVKSAKSSAAKPLRVKEPMIEVRIAKPKPKPPLDMGALSNIEVVSGGSKKKDTLRALKPAGDVLVVKDDRARTNLGVPDAAKKSKRKS